MAGYIPEHKIDEVRNSANVVEVISSYVNLKRAGNIYKGLCPFHAEKTPSFTVNPQRRIFHCFGCGVGGNVFRFLMLQKGISFPEAVAELAERYGIELPRVEAGQIKAQQKTKGGLYKVVALAQKFFEDELWSQSGRQARAYLAGRGLGEDLIREYHLGWAPAAWDSLRLFLDSKGVPADLMETAGLVRPRREGRGHYDTFRARVMCPIFDLDGKTVAFGGRLLQEEEQQPKYLNSPETPIYHKGRILYGLERAREHLRRLRSVFVVEGYFDLLALKAHGVENVVATLGTALTAAHLRLLKGYVDHAVLMFDPDEAGRSAAARALPLFVSADLEGRVLVLPSGHDPDTFVRAEGREALLASMNEAVGLLDFYLDRTVARYPDSLAGKSRAVQEILSMISDVEGPARQELLRKAAAEKLGLSEESLRLSERRQEKSGSEPRYLVEQVEADFETDVLKLVLLHPETGRTILTGEIESYFEGAAAKRLFLALADQFRAQGRIDTERLVQDIEPEEADLVTGLMMGEDGLEGEDLSRVARDYINRFISRSYKRKSMELSKRIKEAQEAADHANLNKLLEEKNRLMKEMNRVELNGRML